MATAGLLAILLRVDVGVLVPGLRRGWDDGVPDDCFRGRRKRRLGREGRSHVDKDLLGVPGEEGCEICKRVVMLEARVFSKGKGVAYQSRGRT